MKNLSLLKVLLLLFWVILFATILGTKLFLPEIYQYFIREDSFSEYSQAIVYFIASTFSLLISYQFLKNGLKLHATLYIILFFGFLFISGEEISWGQRIFSIMNPEYFEQHNVQRELTLHNLDTVQKYLRHLYIFVGAYGAFAWIFRKFLFSNAKSKCDHLVNYVVVDWYLAPYFFVCFFVYSFLHYVRPYFYLNEIGLNLGDNFWFFLHWRDEEHGELFLSLGFVFFVIVNFIKIINNSAVTDRALKEGRAR